MCQKEMCLLVAEVPAAVVAGVLDVHVHGLVVLAQHRARTERFLAQCTLEQN